MSNAVETAPVFASRTRRPSYVAQPVDHRLSSQRRVREMLMDRRLARTWEQDMAALAPEAVQAATERAVATLRSRLV